MMYHTALRPKRIQAALEPVPVRIPSHGGPSHTRSLDDASQYRLDAHGTDTPSHRRDRTPTSAPSTYPALVGAQSDGHDRASLAGPPSPKLEHGTTIRLPHVPVPRDRRDTCQTNTLREPPRKYMVSMVCQSNLDFMRTLSPSSIKLIVTSPPYNIGKKYETRQSLDAYMQKQRQVIEACIRLLHPNGSICWQVGNHINNGEIFPLDILSYDIFKDAGLKLRNRIIWQFEHGLHCTKRLSGRHETILWFTKSDEYTFHLDPIRVPQKYPHKKHHKGPNFGKPSCNPLGKNPGDVWNIPNVKHNHIEKTSHPCQFPIELVERLVLSLTECGDSVLDPYMGVGSTVIAAVKHNRNGFGCDIVSEYVDTAWSRLRALEEGSFRMRPMNRPIYEPPVPRCK